MIKFDGWFRCRTLLVPNLIFGVNRYYFRRLKIWKWSDKGIWNDSFSFHFLGLTITKILDLSILKTSPWAITCTCIANTTIQSLQPVSIASEISVCGNFALAKFCVCQFSLWRNFASVDAKFCQDDSEISSNFRENKELKEPKTPNFVCISFAQYCSLSIYCHHFQSCVLFIFLLLFSLLQHDLHQILKLLSGLLLLLTLSFQSLLL